MASTAARYVCTLPLLAVFSMPATAQGVYSTLVTPQANENISSACRYELTIPQTNVATRAVLVLFDRGREVVDFYNDADVFRFADRERLALLLARHCGSKEREDMDVEPSHGLGRALFRALDQLGAASKHGELQTGKIISLGFSGAGSLAARLPGFAPDRVLASIAYAPGQYEPLGMDTIQLSPEAAAIPQLIIANGDDPVNGTKRPLEFFQKYFDKGAPWVFAIQNGVPHHGGLANTRQLVFAWIEEMLNATPETTGVTTLSTGRRGGSWLYLRTTPSAVRDEWQNPVVHAAEARIEKPGSDIPPNYTAAGWVSARKTASEWLAFVKKSQHPVNAKYP
jgi:dienelactone hydrolase